jgi:peptidyl-prolyl cis-trans isomerase A (cyclophilin A)
MTHKLRSFAALAVSLLVLSACWPAAAQNGIFADFTTSMGPFSCQLDYTNAPKAVANFIGLATGQSAWLDLPSGRARTNAFYNGLRFHRVIAGFMIQGGSPNGQGTDDPGYAFPDEFTPALRFDRFGVLAMANSGPKSNGSQFFVTVAPASWLNDVHTIFGKVVSGSNVVYAISQVATSGDVPVTPVVIQGVAIRRVGTAAQNFNILAQSLPVVKNIGLGLTNTPQHQILLGFTNRQFADNRLYSSTNLNAWAAELLGIEIANAGTNTLVRTNNTPRKFYRFAQIQYASSTFAPKNLNWRTVTLTFSGGAVLTIWFNASGGGPYSFVPYGNGTITSYTYYQDPYRAYLWPIYFSAYYPMTLELDFTSNAGGTFKGTVYATPTVDVSGTFTLQ